ncbi:uncharacterized protein involved in tolerance to divalent cations [Branchiibius hedensis]|uniref:Uncharacterized protein involved in tolerance to divalent cations n=1 Tax=Branchiibius hedensis TaxID=672460 RepID=A0A2Y9A0V5_9MICO|nr:divalent cation tolerance protein CutA [Branchiibius hedensis]PWJ27328.1 uncharacterized protein involved in tolerance to divalent cations [Branchiibius hedensis]SSA36139.1 Uncharacterized protein involved in tolerance to divalent cations [Branchiibius hedensis]
MHQQYEESTPFIQVRVACPNLAEAEQLAAELVAERLAACVQITPGVHSTYRWQGKVEVATETVALITSRSELFEQLAARVTALHSYDVPEIVASPIAQVSSAYAEWLAGSLLEPGEDHAAPAVHLEIERKFTLADDGLIPEPGDWPRVGQVSNERRYLLLATYYDTPGLDLASHGVTLRRRQGGPDEGWHLKLPRSGDARMEEWMPFGSDDAPPAQFRDQVRQLTGAAALVPVCEVRTHRVERDLLAGDVHLACLCDDHVSTHNLLDDQLDSDWHELEVELVNGGMDFLDEVADHLSQYGVQQASVASKLAMALGPLLRRSDPDLEPAGS